jgi:hypothetical protein
MMTFLTGRCLAAGCLLLTCTIFPGAAVATYGEHCDQQYSSEVDDCHSNYDDDPADAAALASCIQDARDNYGSCFDECAGPVGASSSGGPALIAQCGARRALEYYSVDNQLSAIV